ncbi:MAG: nucleotidyltransferase substrate binding protein [Desulfuromonadales bacterium]|nr:nucleotidyltransferase substrate binding protein [Desulfuromonadales bacterium]
METKFTRKLNDLEAALSNFREALTLEPSLFPELVADNIKSGQVQKFEFTVELLWKTIQVFLFEVDGVDAITPKSVAKEFVEAGHCDYEAYELLIRAINDRNQLSHIYRQEMAESIWKRLPEYVCLVEQIVRAMRSKIQVTM